MASMQEEVEKYKAQVKQYDAGRPNTAVPQKPAQGFQPAESAGMAMPSPARAPIPAQQGGGARWNMGDVVRDVASEYGKDRQRRQDIAVSAVKSAAGALGRFGENMTEGRYLGTSPNAPRAPLPTPGTAAPATPAISPDQKVQNDVVKEITDSRARSALNASTLGVDMRNLPSPEQIRATTLERGGFERNVPKTANPGLTLSATPAAPRKPLAYSGVFSQPDPQEALQRKQMEVMAAERADKTLLTAPGSRDYISPTLTEPQQRARQAEIAMQRKQDGEDVAAQQINSATIKAMDDQAKGITSDRNLAMLPYAERRAAINNRNALTTMNADMQQKRLDDAAKAADRTAGNERAQMEDSTKRAEIDARVGLEGQKLTSEERRAQMTDSTTRRGQDLEQETNRTNAEIAAQSKALDREATIKAAQIRAPQTKDPVTLEKIKGYNASVASLYAQPGAAVTEDMLKSLMIAHGLTAADMGAASMAGVNPAEDPDFLN